VYSGEGIRALFKGDSVDGGLLSGVPEVELLVPAGGDKAAVLEVGEPGEALDGGLVLSDLGRLLGVQIPHHDALISASGEDGGAGGVPIGTKEGLGVVELEVLCRGAIGINSVHPSLAIPARRQQRPRVCPRGEGQRAH
jgi:hypothetical protein